MLFSEIVYGPIHSRRLGTSLGINLMPVQHKLCSFNCVYCECGFNTPVHAPQLPSTMQVHDALEQKLRSLQQQHITPDVITFSGNGEPTMHPSFYDIIDHTCRLRDIYCPNAQVAVLSNATQLFRNDVVDALMKVDQRILKLDSAVNATMHLIDQPVNPDLTVCNIVAMLKKFHGDFTLQTCFLKGQYLNQTIDNTTPEELNAWYQVVRELHPKHIMIYVIDRATPVETLQKIDPATMQTIAEHLRAEGFDVTVSA